MKTKGMVTWIALIAMTMGGFVTPLHAENIEGNENLITKDIQIDDYTAIQIGNINQSGVISISREILSNRCFHSSLPAETHPVSLKYIISKGIKQP